MSDFGEALASAFGKDRVRRDAPLAPLTTFRVGGPAEFLFEPRTTEEIVAALTLATNAQSAWPS